MANDNMHQCFKLLCKLFPEKMKRYNYEDCNDYDYEYFESLGSVMTLEWHVLTEILPSLIVKNGYDSCGKNNSRDFTYALAYFPADNSFHYLDSQFGYDSELWELEASKKYNFWDNLLDLLTNIDKIKDTLTFKWEYDRI